MAIMGREWLEKKFLPWFGPVALLALIYTVLVLFGLQVGAQLLSVSYSREWSVPFTVLPLHIIVAVAHLQCYVFTPHCPVAVCSPQAKNVLDHFGDVCRVAVPMFLYFMIMWIATLMVTRKFHSTYEQCVTQVTLLCSCLTSLHAAEVMPTCFASAVMSEAACAEVLRTHHAELHGILQQLRTGAPLIPY
jgi:ACR3 family arsenite efflux pump ArsB